MCKRKLDAVEKHFSLDFDCTLNVFLNNYIFPMRQVIKT